MKKRYKITITEERDWHVGDLLNLHDGMFKIEEVESKTIVTVTRLSIWGRIWLWWMTLRSGAA